MKLYQFILLLFVSTAPIAQNDVFQVEPADRQRVAEITSLLSELPRGFGEPIERRQHWDLLLKSGQFTSLLKEADSLAALPFPKLTDKIYLSYYEGKDSETSKRFIMNRRIWLSKLVWAECLSNQGKYLAAIGAALKDITDTMSWSFPAEDRSKTNYEGRVFTIALSSSSYGYEVAQTLYLLRTKLDRNLQNALFAALQEKIFQPVLDAVESGDAKEQYTSLTNKGNYNPVTLANVTGAALATIRDKNLRAKFIAIAERYSNNYLLGFSDDGYCSEGIGYYNYGFGHYVMLREQLWQATQGKVDIFRRPKVEKAAHFIPSIEIINNVFPAIGDSEQYPKPDGALMYYLNRQFRLEMPPYDSMTYKNIRQPSLMGLMYFFPSSLSKIKNLESRTKGQSLRHFFEEAGVLVVRPAKISANSMGAIFKGGHNAEMHNHNDVGSFSVVLGDELLLGDPGAATYTPKYFGSERYKLFKTTASYGHPVPLINGHPQRNGKNAAATNIQTSFDQERDLIRTDLRLAYPDSGLKKMERIFTYQRTENGILSIRDNFNFSSPGTFETALITRYQWLKSDDDKILIRGKNNTLQIRIRASTEAVQISEEIIDEGPEPYTRIAIRLDKKTAGGWLEMTFETLVHKKP